MRKVLSQSSKCDLASDSDERRFDEQCGGTSRIIDLLSHKEELVGGNNKKKNVSCRLILFFREEDCLGLGLRIERNKSGKITSLYTGLDIVSWTAYNSLGVRNGDWKNGIVRFFVLLSFN